MNEYFEFPLTEELIDQIIFCMEDQGAEYGIDSENGEILSGEKISGEKVIPLPEWKSSDGYLMMEKFISSLHNPIYKEELRQVMSVGKGVFKNFKKIVKSYDPMKKKWFSFKDRYMKDLVVKWYGINREAGYFERMGTDTLDTENIVLSDFSFKTDCLDRRKITEEEKTAFMQIFPDEPLMGMYYFEKMKEVRTDPEKDILSVCSSTLGGAFSGVIWGWVWECSEGILLIIKEFFVKSEYRGLGLGKVLIEKLSKKAENEGIDRIYFEVPGKLLHINMMLEKQGFATAGSSYSLNFKGITGAGPK